MQTNMLKGSDPHDQARSSSDGGLPTQTDDRNRLTYAFCGHLACTICESRTLLFRPLQFSPDNVFPAPFSQTLHYMVKRQKINRPTQCAFVNFPARIDSIRKIKNLSLHLDVSNATFFRTVAIFDLVISGKTYSESEYNIILVVCLTIICKLSESFTKVPSPTEIANYLAPYFHENDVPSWEKAILMELSWQTNVLTVFDFTDLFLQQGVLNSKDFQENASPQTGNVFVNALQDIMLNFTHLTLMEFRFYKFTPLCVAASIVACCRGILGLPFWSEQLQSLTGLEFARIQSCVNSLWSSLANPQTLDSFQGIISQHFDDSQNSIHQMLHHISFPTSSQSDSTVSNPPTQIDKDKNLEISETELGPDHSPSSNNSMQPSSLFLAETQPNSKTRFPLRKTAKYRKITKRSPPNTKIPPKYNEVSILE